MKITKTHNNEKKQLAKFDMEKIKDKILPKLEIRVIENSIISTLSKIDMIVHNSEEYSDRLFKNAKDYFLEKKQTEYQDTSTKSSEYQSEVGKTLGDIAKGIKDAKEVVHIIAGDEIGKLSTKRNMIDNILKRKSSFINKSANSLYDGALNDHFKKTFESFQLILNFSMNVKNAYDKNDINIDQLEARVEYFISTLYKQSSYIDNENIIAQHNEYQDNIFQRGNLFQKNDKIDGKKIIIDTLYGKNRLIITNNADQLLSENLFATKNLTMLSFLDPAVHEYLNDSLDTLNTSIKSVKFSEMNIKDEYAHLKDNIIRQKQQSIDAIESIQKSIAPQKYVERCRQ